MRVHGEVVFILVGIGKFSDVSKSVCVWRMRKNQPTLDSFPKRALEELDFHLSNKERTGNPDRVAAVPEKQAPVTQEIPGMQATSLISTVLICKRMHTLLMLTFVLLRTTYP